MFLLAIPYRSKNNLLKKARFKVACDMVRYHGENIFCPLVYAHTIYEMNGESNIDSLYKTFMRIAEGLFVYKLPGWETDPDIIRLINFFSLTNQTITYIDPLPEHMTGGYAEVWNNFAGKE